MTNQSDARVRLKAAVEESIDELMRVRTELARVTAERDKYDHALHSLTAGGSEFAHDAKACVDHVRERQHAQHRLIVKFKLDRDEAIARAEAAESKLSEARSLFLEEACRIVCSHCRDGQTLSPIRDGKFIHDGNIYRVCGASALRTQFTKEGK